MATVTNFANAFETTLTADMLATDLVAEVQSTVGAPTSPCYMVLEPNNADRREYVLFDGSFSATTFSATTINNRYLAGSAGASDIVHPSGSVVRFAPVAQHFQNIQNSAVWLDEAQTITGAKTFSVDPTLADGSSALSQTEGNAAYKPLGATGSQRVETSESTTSLTYTDLATVGPTVTVDVPASGIAVVSIVTQLQHATSTEAALVSFALSGANTVAASDDRALLSDGTNLESVGGRFRLTGLAAGSTTFTIKYRSSSSGSAASFRRRELIVEV